MVRLIAMPIATDILIFGNTCVSPKSHWVSTLANVNRHDAGPRLHP
jgi:hypothetical protein